MSPLDLVSRFASALDAEDYPSAQSCLAELCVYESPEGDATGPAAIVESYKGNGDIARERFDTITYRHEAVPLGEGWYQITFIDELAAAGRAHVFRCRQRLHVDGGRIARIVHEEIPGERAARNAFVNTLT